MNFYCFRRLKPGDIIELTDETMREWNIHHREQIVKKFWRSGILTRQGWCIHPDEILRKIPYPTKK